MFGNVNVDYQPCKTAVQLQKAADYILGRLPEQIRDGVVKTAPTSIGAWDATVITMPVMFS